MSMSLSAKRYRKEQLDEEERLSVIDEEEEE